MSDFTYENDVSTMSVTRSLAMSSAPAGGLVCIGGAQIGTMITLLSDKTVYVGRDSDKMPACHYGCKGKPGSLQLYLCRNDQSVPCRGSVEKALTFLESGELPGNRSGVLSETDDQIVYSK